MNAKELWVREDSDHSWRYLSMMAKLHLILGENAPVYLVA